MFRLNRKYLLFALLLLVVEILIALFVRDGFVRPYVGDYLVVMLIYCLLKAFVNISNIRAAVVVLLFSYSVEVLQFLHIVDQLGLENNRLARTIIGYGFEWWDMLAYTLGALTIIAVEWSFGEKNIRHVYLSGNRVRMNPPPSHTNGNVN